MMREFKMMMVVLFAFSGVALAEENPGEAPKAAKATKERMPPETIFKQFDKDGDGSVTLEEFTEQRKVIMERRAKAKGQPAREVKEAHFKKAFEVFDADKSGGISQEEFVNHFAQQRKAGKAKGGKARAGKAKGGKAKGGKAKAASAE
jgi:Ca2+-binding EF-hand superfamily protein